MYSTSVHLFATGDLTTPSDSHWNRQDGACRRATWIFANGARSQSSGTAPLHFPNESRVPLERARFDFTFTYDDVNSPPQLDRGRLPIKSALPWHFQEDDSKPLNLQTPRLWLTTRAIYDTHIRRWSVRGHGEHLEHLANGTQPRSSHPFTHPAMRRQYMQKTSVSKEASRSLPWPLRGIPSLATCEVPVNEVKTERKKTVDRSLRSRKIENEVLVTTKKEVPRTGPFNLLSLPAELRVRIYKICVSVDEYIAYDERDYCTCEQEHRRGPRPDQSPVCKFVYNYTLPEHTTYHPSIYRVSAPASGLDKPTVELRRPRRPGCFYLMPHQRGDVNRLGDAKARMTPRPNILQANRQIRGEALEVFYKMNDFVFERCDPCFLTRWIYNGVQPEHLKYIKSIAWDGPLGGASEECYCPLDKDHICSTIMLMQLGFLGQCKLRLRCTLEDYDVHLGCVLNKKICELVQRKGLTSKHALNEHSKLDCDEVRGLTYCVFRNFTKWWREYEESENRLEDGHDNEACCASQPEGDRSEPWISMKPLTRVIEEVEDTVVD
jgi:hypothetical protein